MVCQKPCRFFATVTDRSHHSRNDLAGWLSHAWLPPRCPDQALVPGLVPLDDLHKPKACADLNIGIAFGWLGLKSLS
jgi:hypothetical protein